MVSRLIKVIWKVVFQIVFKRPLMIIYKEKKIRYSTWIVSVMSYMEQLTQTFGADELLRNKQIILGKNIYMELKSAQMIDVMIG